MSGSHARKILLGLLAGCFIACSQKQQEPWKPEQLMPVAELAERISENKAPATLICIGPGALIKGSLDAGQTRDPENLERLRELVTGQDRDAEIVLYCGCCPFKDCPNIRPAFSLLNSMGFTGHRLLDIHNNLKTDWIDKGYPVDMRAENQDMN